MHEPGGNSAQFNPASPDGSYSLDLAVAADRVVAVQLVELDRASSDKELLRGISLEGKVGCVVVVFLKGFDKPCCVDLTEQEPAASWNVWGTVLASLITSSSSTLPTASNLHGSFSCVL